MNGKILIVLDESNEVLKQGIRLANDEHARVTVLKVVPAHHGSPLPDGKGMSGDMCSVAWSGGVQVKTRVSAGDRTDRIVEVAKEEKCDLIVMGKRKKEGLLGRLFGDRTAKKVIERAGCPVFVVGSSCAIMRELPAEQSSKSNQLHKAQLAT